MVRIKLFDPQSTDPPHLFPYFANNVNVILVCLFHTRYSSQVLRVILSSYFPDLSRNQAETIAMIFRLSLSSILSGPNPKMKVDMRIFGGASIQVIVK